MHMYVLYVDEEKKKLWQFLRKLVQIFLKFSQQIVEGYELCWQSFARKSRFSQPKFVI